MLEHKRKGTLKKDRLSTYIVAVRHGQSLANFIEKGPFIGDETGRHAATMILEDHEIPLTALGISQAKKLGKFLRKKFGVPDVVIDSGYLRAIETRQSALHSGYTKKEIAGIIIKSDDRFRERECGTMRKVPKELRESLPHWKQHQKDYFANPYQTRPIDGESIADMIPRIRQAWQEIENQYPHLLIFIFCHGHVLRAIELSISHLTVAESIKFIKETRVANCEVHSYRSKKNKSDWKKIKKFKPLSTK